MSAQFFASKVHALEWAEQQPKDSGRIYMVVFKRFFKVGRTRHFGNRLRGLLGNYPSAGVPVLSILVGPESDNIKPIELRVHRRLEDLQFRDGRWSLAFREWYCRNASVEEAVSQWIREGYSETLLPAIELAVAEKPQEVTK